MKTIYYSTILILLYSMTGCGSEKNEQKKETKTFKIASFNVRNAKGMDNITDFDRVANVINSMDAHAVAIQELDSATDRSNKLVVIDELAKRTNMHASFTGSISFKGGKYGNGILTKEKPLRQKRFELPGKEEARSLLIVELENFVLCCTHLSLNEADRLSSINLIKEHTVDYDSKPVFLAGDLNANPHSKEIKALTKNWILISDFTQPTFPSKDPNKIIDYILLKPNDKYKHKVTATKVVEETMASDHRPLWSEVKIEWHN